MDVYKELLSKESTAIRSNEFLPYVPLSEYNIFDILEVTVKEIVMCHFLTDLLDPEGAHGYGILFLKSFFQNVLHDNRVNDALLMHTDIIKEYIINNNQKIDIVIQNARYFIPIEVKIYGEEQEGQCYAYYEYAKTFFEDAQVVYLTRFKTEPSEYSKKKKNGTEILSNDRIKCISWEEDICHWLTSLLSQLNEPVKSAVMQYIDAIHKIADRREDKVMEKTLEILYESTDFFNAGIQIERSMKAAKLKLMRLVFEDFEKEMEILAPKYGLELENKINYYTYEDEEHENFYDCYSTFPGLNYVVKNAKFKECGLQMWFRIEVEQELCAGVTLFDTEGISEGGNLEDCQVDEITDELIDEAAQYLNRDIIMPTDWWLTWCYSNGKRQDDVYEDVPDFKEMNQCAINLVDGQKRKTFVKDAMKNFEEQILKYLLKR